MAGVVRTPADAANALALDANALAGLRQQAREAPDKALSKAAGQFEALFLNMVLKQMRQSLPKDGPLDSDSMRTYTAMFDQQVAQQLSARGIGLREALERQLARHVNGATPAIDARVVPRPVASKFEARPATHAPAQASPVPVHSVTASVQAFVDKLRPHAEAAAKALGVPVPLLIAQAGLETGWGRSQPRNADGSASHNLFGVKAGRGWSGASVAAATTEFVQGTAVRTVEKFRSYGSYTDAFRDLARLLSTRRYADALANAADPAAYAKSLQRAGYATDPAYADKLTRAIRMVSQQLAATPPTDGIRVAQAAAAQEAPAAADMSSDARA
jgi:flagellar protein FlgJ